MRAQRLFQISDTHLLAPGVPAAGAAWARLDAVIAWIEAGPLPDAILLTGDLADLPDAAVYRDLAERLERLPIPVLPLPGNHDDPALLAAHLPAAPVAEPSVRHCGDWAIVLLDSQRPGECGGYLGAERLAALATRLAAIQAPHCLIAVHHPPVPIGSPWMDVIGLADGSALIDLLARDGRVRAVVWGHVHQRHESRQHGMHLLACPATRVQFVPRATACQTEDARPAFRWLDLHPDGRVETGVVRLPEPGVSTGSP